jgi:TrpR-related protein YerC/YecD
VSFGGCPGFKGPDPQPVSMSVGKSRVPPEERQGDSSAGTAARECGRTRWKWHPAPEPRCTCDFLTYVLTYYYASTLIHLSFPMKEHRALTPRQEALAERALFGAILTLRTVEECRAFFRDLCTPAELQALADRWAVVGLLQQGVPYREIHKQTGVSVTTIGRVARYLTNGNGGYTLAATRSKEVRAS